MIKILETCDKILRFMLENNRRIYIYNDPKTAEFISQNLLTNDEVYRAIDHLKDEQLIEPPERANYYDLTVKGEIFIEKDGYLGLERSLLSTDVITYPIIDPAIHHNKFSGIFKWIIKHIVPILLTLFGAVIFYLLVGYWKQCYDSIFGIKPY